MSDASQTFGALPLLASFISDTRVHIKVGESAAVEVTSGLPIEFLASCAIPFPAHLAPDAVLLELVESMNCILSKTCGILQARGEPAELASLLRQATTGASLITAAAREVLKHA
jgi:hypothetical protein